MTIHAEILADSIGHDAPRLTTFLVRYPRFIHPEVLRHRPMSHSVGSSRAVPVKRMLANVIADPAEPVEWGSNQPGMQAGEELTGWRLRVTRGAWHGAKWAALGAAYLAMKAGAHKQVVNRIIEPWTHTVEIITATDLASFFALRIHDAADPTIRALANAMREAMRNAPPPDLMEEGWWHLPLITDIERVNFPAKVLRRVSAARCARTSYLNHDRSAPKIGRDLELAARLEKDAHWSPFEHQASPDLWLPSKEKFAHPDLHGNLTGWIQDRKTREIAA